jgi:ABC-type lipoprotein release transport system permease subunit
MSVLRLLLREIQHRKLNFLLAIVSVVLAVGLFASVQTMVDASQREAVRLMRDLGFNVLILPEGVKKEDWYSRRYATKEMPEENVRKLANSRTMLIRHLVARLQKMTTWRGHNVLLTGILPEVTMTHRPKKAPMGLKIPRGQVYLGRDIARVTGLGKGAVIDDLAEGKTFTVAGELVPKEPIDNIRIAGHLHDIQEILGKPGRINEIEGLMCLCPGAKPTDIDDDVARVIPGAQLVKRTDIAETREQTRLMMERYSGFIIPAVVAVCVVWVGLLMLSNVRSRRAEIGLLRAMGVGGGKIAALFLGKAVAVGLLGAAAGFAAGTALAMTLGPEIFPITAGKIKPAWDLLGWSLLGATLLCALAAYLPAMLAVAQDPADALREE